MADGNNGAIISTNNFTQNSIAGVWMMTVDELIESDSDLLWIKSTTNSKVGVDSDGVLWCLDQTNSWITLCDQC